MFAGPSDRVMVVIQTAEDTCLMIFDLTTAIIRNGKVPTDLEQSLENQSLDLS